MTFRENVMAILNYESFEKMPVVAFGYWEETLKKWHEEGHIEKWEAEGYYDNSPADRSIMKKLGFDMNWGGAVEGNHLLDPPFTEEVLQVEGDGSKIIRDANGLICKVKPGIISIPAEIGTSLVDRKSWETLYLPRLQMSESRVDLDYVRSLPKPEEREYPLSVSAGSLIGNMRSMLGVEQLSYLYCDDEDLYKEIVDVLCGLCYDVLKLILDTGVQFDYAHFWEDICFKNGPLVTPQSFDELMGPWYQRITDLTSAHGISIVSVDCDGLIDALIPTWLHNGVNTMFPIEVGTWNASIAPWREKYGRIIRGVGGMNKTVFSQDKAAVDAEVERLRPLIDLGGFIPCPDHRIAPDAKFELVQYYCDKMQNLKL